MRKSRTKERAIVPVQLFAKGAVFVLLVDDVHDEKNALPSTIKFALGDDDVSTLKLGLLCHVILFINHFADKVAVHPSRPLLLVSMI